MSTVISIENLWKQYRLGVIGHGTLTHDLQSWWARVRGKEDPNAKIDIVLEGQEKQIEEDRFWALRDINLEVEQGEVLGIIGKNGTGKSTLLKILSRVTAPTRGNIKVKGRIASLLEVGTGFHPELTGRENIFLNGAILGMSKQEVKRNFDEIVNFSGVEDFIDTPVKRYSSGMYVRLAFAVAAHLDPEILLIDEVLAVGDVEFQKKCLEKVKAVTSEGRTVLFVSHNMASIETLCQKAILLENGKMIFNGYAEDTVAHYLGSKICSEVQSYVDLSHTPNRETKCKPVFQSLRLLNHKGEQTSGFQVGEPIFFEINLNSRSKKLRSPSILVNIIDNRERQICRFLTDVMVRDAFEINGKSVVRCIWNACWLMPGKYHVDLKIKERYKEALDTIIQAISFNVLPNDIYKTGRIDKKGEKANPLIVPDGKWVFKKTGDQLL